MINILHGVVSTLVEKCDKTGKHFLVYSSALIFPSTSALLQAVRTRDGPPPQQRLVEAWAELHQDELLADWNLLEQGRRPGRIAPLQ